MNDLSNGTCCAVGSCTVGHFVAGTSVKMGQFVKGTCAQRELFHGDSKAPRGTSPQASLCLERQLHFHDDSSKNRTRLVIFSADRQLALRNKSPASLGA